MYITYVNNEDNVFSIPEDLQATKFHEKIMKTLCFFEKLRTPLEVGDKVLDYRIQQKLKL